MSIVQKFSRFYEALYAHKELSQYMDYFRDTMYRAHNAEDDDDDAKDVIFECISELENYNKESAFYLTSDYIGFIIEHRDSRIMRNVSDEFDSNTYTLDDMIEAIDMDSHNLTEDMLDEIYTLVNCTLADVAQSIAYFWKNGKF